MDHALFTGDIDTGGGGAGYTVHTVHVGIWISAIAIIVNFRRCGGSRPPNHMLSAHGGDRCDT